MSTRCVAMISNCCKFEGKLDLIRSYFCGDLEPTGKPFALNLQFELEKCTICVGFLTVCFSYWMWLCSFPIRTCVGNKQKGIACAVAMCEEIRCSTGGLFFCLSVVFFLLLYKKGTKQ